MHPNTIYKKALMDHTLNRQDYIPFLNATKVPPKPLPNPIDDILKPKLDVAVKKATSSFNNISEKAIMSWNKLPKMGKVGVAVGASIIAFNMLGNTVKRAFDDKKNRKLPEYYDRGFNILKAHTTDFGSPVKLVKTAMKVITPYHSSIRKGVRTSVHAYTKGHPALALAKNAIGHMRY